MGFSEIVVSIPEDAEKPFGQGLKEPAMGGPASVGGTSPDDLQGSLQG